MKLFGRIVSPLMTFIGIQLVWILVVIFWVSWFMGSHRRLRLLAEKYSPELLQGGIDWFILVEGLVLLGAILVGVYVIFLYWRRQVALNRAQRDFVAQVTHELKSPLASLKLHLETIRRHHPSPEKMETFLDTMLADTERLDDLTNNMLSANKVGQRGIRLTLRPCDLSDLVTGYFRPRQFALPKAGTMNLDIAPGLFARVDKESLETVFRNLMENALLYASGPPVIRVTMEREGTFAHFTFSDQGMGIAKRDQKKVFRMFYRVRQTGKTIRGSGLGLFIVRALVRLHRGKVWLESSGEGRGTAIHILLPLIDPAEAEGTP
ncbi:HAMP domain-containing sensor histidine kinase [uncultured Desulfuromonas sp.]|uniref:sensor histidine kinase n=1 Tax=uncultured Desulfuromonas sp. TaxID=181013 RepID=UPI00262FA073|nr:HAMP domain-containing sensor histidine kinase [uncultured Desulfuromonas sp.]